MRSTFYTLLLKNQYSPKSVAKLMGHAKEITTVDVYGDNRGIIADGVPEILDYMEDVLPRQEQQEGFTESLLDIVIDIDEYLEKEHKFAKGVYILSVV